jgi:hypothetical protein
MRRFLFALAIAVIAVVPLTGRDSLASGWCRTDPIVSLNGHEGSIWLVTEVDPNWQPGTVAWIQIEHPRNVDAAVVFIDPNHGFSSYNVWLTPSRALKKTGKSIDVRVTIFTWIPQAPSSGAGIEWANSAGGYPIAASVYGAVGNVLTLQTELTW